MVKSARAKRMEKHHKRNTRGGALNLVWKSTTSAILAVVH